MYQLAFSRLYKKNVSKISDNSLITKEIFSHYSFLFWEEHCVECVAKDGFNSCSLHKKRPDGGCASLENSFEILKNSQAIDGFSVHTRFTRWAKIESQWPSKPVLYKPYIYKFFSRIFLLLDRFFFLLSSFSKILKNKNWSTYETYRSYIFRSYKYIADNSRSSSQPDYLLLQIENLNTDSQSNLQIEILSDYKISYRNNFILNKKINTIFISFDELKFDFKKESLFRIWCDDQIPPDLIIHWAHLVKMKNQTSHESITVNNILPNKLEKASVKKIKCVVFDLDNTLWEGIVGDDEESNIVLKKYVLDFINELDSRGILCSIASKNDFDIAWKKLIEFKLEKYFVFPEINWGEKYISLKKIATNLNIGIDTIAFIDDSAYERRAVNNFLPDIKIFEKISKNLINDESFDVLVTDESKSRRKFYLSDTLRKKDQNLYYHDELAFVKSCKMKINLLDSKNNILRCTELLQRTNQFNIHFYKFNKEELLDHINENESFCWNLIDKYGDYGIVGFLSYKTIGECIEISQFTISCRAAARYVEDSLFSWFYKFSINSMKSIKIKFYKTGRNNPIYEKLKNIGFKSISNNNKYEDLILYFNEDNKFSDIIKISDTRKS